MCGVPYHSFYIYLSVLMCEFVCLNLLYLVVLVDLLGRKKALRSIKFCALESMEFIVCITENVKILNRN